MEPITIIQGGVTALRRDDVDADVTDRSEAVPTQRPCEEGGGRLGEPSLPRLR